MSGQKPLRVERINIKSEKENFIVKSDVNIFLGNKC